MSANPAASTPLRFFGKRDVSRVTLADLPDVRAHALTNQLYGARGLRTDGLLWFWQSGWPSRIQEWITFTAEGSRLQLALDGDVVGLDPRQIDWRHYEGDTQLLAWTACHEPLIALLRAMFQCDWVPESIGDCDVSLPDDCLRVGFALHRADGLTLVNGAVILDTSSVQRLAARDRFFEPRLHHPMKRVRARLPLFIDEIEVEPAEVAHIGRGSIIRLDNRTLLAAPARVVIPAGHIQLIADVNEVRATVVGYAAQDAHVDPSRYCEGDSMSTDRPSPTEMPMNESVSGADAHRAESHRAETHRAETHRGVAMNGPGPAAERDRAVAVGSLPVRLTFSAGRLTVPFAEVADIGPGYVFELDRRLDDQAITVHANDVPIAVGELVAIGDLVGVRITRMLPGA